MLVKPTIIQHCIVLDVTFLDKPPSSVHTHTYLDTVADHVILAKFSCTEKRIDISAHKVNFHPVHILLTQT